jgi:Trypsin
MPISGRPQRFERSVANRAHGTTWALSRLAGFVVLVFVLVGLSGGDALGVVGGKTVLIATAPWNVVVRSAGYETCTGVIIDARQILTAEHCMMQGESAKPESLSEFSIEAGVSNFKHPLKSDDPQTRGVSGERLIPGYIAASQVSEQNTRYEVGHDVAVLTLSRPLDLNGVDARAAHLPSATMREPPPKIRLVTAGFGNESMKAGAEYANGTLNAVGKSTVAKVFSTKRTLAAYQNSGTSWGDSGSGLIEPGRHPTVVGILSTSTPLSLPGFPRYISNYVALTAPPILRFIKAGN